MLYYVFTNNYIDLNKIEHYWFKVKNDISKTYNEFRLFFDSVHEALKNINVLVG